MPTPFYIDAQSVIYHGDALEIVPELVGKVAVDAIVTDPPYAETNLKWDKWPAGWPSAAARLSKSLWVFGTVAMYFKFMGEFAPWKYAQDVIWEKQNGTGMRNDRFRRVHETLVHFYQGRWDELYKDPRYIEVIERRHGRVLRHSQPQHWGKIKKSSYTFNGTRLVRSVIRARNEHRTGFHPTQKPLDVLRPVIEYSVPRGGTVIDFFMGSGSTLVAARELGRRSIGIEANEKDCQTAVDRILRMEHASNV